jgi:replicative DNA helicase
MNAPAPNLSNRDSDRFDNETGLLGALLIHGEPTLYRAAAAICTADHFHDRFNARLFETIGRGVDSGLHAFRLTHWIIGELKGDAALRDLNVPASAMVARYCAQAFPGIAVEGAARQVRHDHLSVELALAVEDGATAAAEEIAAEMERLSRAHLQNDTGLQPIGAAASDVLRALSEAYQAGGAATDFAYAGSHALGRVIGGWRRGRLYIVAGRPGMGKTTTALSWLLRTAKQGHGVFFASLEMGRQELVEMALCDISYDRNNRVEYRDIAATAVREPGFEDRFRHVYDAAPRLDNLPFMISDRAGQTVAEIRSAAQQYAQRLAAAGQRLDVVVIDHLNLIKPTGAYAGSKTAETEEVSAALKVMAKELQCAVICLCQLNRAVEGREEKRPGLSDLRWSGAIEQDADVVMFVYREAYYLERTKSDDMGRELERTNKLEACRNRLEVIFGKHRGGPCPVLEFYADMGCGVVRDMESRS